MKLNAYERTAIAEILTMAEGRISLHGFGAFTIRAGRRIVSLGKERLSDQGRAFLKKHCRPFTVSEIEKQVTRKVRNIERLTRLIHAATDQSKFESASKFAQKAGNQHDELIEIRRKLTDNKTSYYTLLKASRNAYKVHLVVSRLVA